MSQRSAKPIIDFTGYIIERTRYFTGREWVFKAIDDWLADPKRPRFFLLTGEPGSGKTAISGRLYQFAYAENTVPLFEGPSFLTPGFLSAVHFCSAQDRRWINPQIFAQSLAMQLAERDPIYAQALAEQSRDRHIQIEVEQRIGQAAGGQITGVVINRLDVSGVLPEDVFDCIVREPLEAVFHQRFDHQLIILVDGLDQALEYGGNVNIVSLLAQTNNLPTGVRFLLTSRQDSRVENDFLNADGLSLSAIEFNERNREDIRGYVKGRLRNDQGLTARVAQLEPIQVTELTEQITSKAAGNFQYVHFLLKAMAQGQRSITELEGLPEGLDGLYFDTLKHIVKLGQHEWVDDYAPLLGILSVAQESLTLPQLQAFTKQGELAIWTYLADLQQLIEEVKPTDDQERETKYCLFHQSFVNFLHRQWLIIEKKHLHNSFYLPADEWHMRIVDYYRAETEVWESIDWEQVDDYGLLHLATHLYALRGIKAYRQDLYGLICKSFMREKYMRYASHRPYAENVLLAIELAHNEEPPNIVQEIRGSLLYATLSSLTTKIPLDALAALTQAGQATKALGFAILMQDSKKKSQAYLMIGKILLQLKDFQEAHRVLMQGLIIAESIGDKEDMLAALVEISETLAQTSHFSEVMKVVETIRSKKDQSSVLRIVAHALILVQTEQFDQALTVVKLIKEKETKAALELALLEEIAVILAQTKLISQILSNAEGITEKRQTIFVLIRASQILAGTGESELAVILAKQALADAETIGDERNQLYALSNMIHALAHIGQFDQALTMAESIGDEWTKAVVLMDIVWSMIQVGEQPRAIVVAKLAFTVAEEIRDEEVKAALLTYLIRKLAQAGEHPQALLVSKQLIALVREDVTYSLNIQKSTLEERFEEDEIGVTGLRELTEALTRARQLDEILDEAESLANERDRVFLLIAVAQALAKAGEKDQSVTVAKQVLVMAQELQDHLNYVFVLKETAQILAEVGQFAEALTVAVAIVNMVDRATALIEVVRALIQTKQLDWALEVAETIEYVEYRETALKEIATALVKIGQPDEILANTLVVQMSEGDKALLLMEIAKALISLGQLNKAQVIAEEIEFEWAKAHILGEVALALYEQRKRNRAKHVAKQALAAVKKIGYERDRAIALKEMTMVFIKMSMFDQAVAVAVAIENEQAKAEALGEVALVLTQLGQIDEAMTAIRIVGDEKVQSNVLINMTLILVKLGQFDQALSATMTIKGEENRAKVVKELVQALMQAGEKARALSVANLVLAVGETIENDWGKAFMLKAMAMALVQSGQFDQALTVVEAIRNDWDRATALKEVALAVAEKGEEIRAISIANRALAVAEIVGSESLQLEARSNLFQVLVTVGEFDQALKAVEAISNEWSKAAALKEAVLALAQSGNLDRALAITEVIEDYWNKAAALMEVTLVLLQSEQFDQALTLAEVIEDDRYKAKTLREIVLTLVEKGEEIRAVAVADKALAIAKVVGDEALQLHTLGSMILVQIKIGQFDQALRMTETIRNEWNKVKVLEEVAEVLAQMGERAYATWVANRALMFVEMVMDKGDKALALKKVAQLLVLTGEKDRALVIVNQASTLAKMVKDEDDKAFLLKEVSLVLAQAGQFDKALRVAKSIEKKSDRATALSEVSQILIREGQYDQALSVAKVIANEETEAAILSSAAQALAQMGQIDRALVVTDMIKPKRDKGITLSLIAQVLNLAGQNEQAMNVTQATLAAARPTGRETVFEVMGYLTGILGSINEGQTLWRVYEAIQEIDGWWGI